MAGRFDAKFTDYAISMMYWTKGCYYRVPSALAAYLATAAVAGVSHLLHFAKFFGHLPRLLEV